VSLVIKFASHADILSVENMTKSQSIISRQLFPGVKMSKNMHVKVEVLELSDVGS